MTMLVPEGHAGARGPCFATGTLLTPVAGTATWGNDDIQTQLLLKSIIWDCGPTTPRGCVKV